MRGFLLLFIVLLPAFAKAEDRWLLIDKQPYQSIENWAQDIQAKVFYDKSSGRILFERKKTPLLILLKGAPYALRGGKFLSLPDAPVEKSGTVLISLEQARRLFFPVLSKTEQAKILAQVPTPIREEQKDIKTTSETKEIPKEHTISKQDLNAAPLCRLDRLVKKVFLDPGHGGQDYGTKKAGISEKDVVLKFSRLVADELVRRGFEVNFSRTKDVYLPLDIRSSLAKEWKADIFISLHVNSSPSGGAHGTETYILSQDATDAAARKLALLENSIVQEAKEKQSAVQDILWDMEQTTYLQDSAYLASYIQEAIVTKAHDILKKQNAGDWKNRGVRQAPFFVLNRAAMPAVLVELGYLSNVRDRKLLLTKSFQERLAKALAEGVQKYQRACR